MIDMYLNWKKRELDLKIVYYGPPRSGKTTNLEQIYAKVGRKQGRRLVTLKTEGDRTLFFDFLPLEIGELKGLKPRINLYTVPGQSIYAATRRIVLEEVDGIVFVADSRRGRYYDNIQAMKEMKGHLRALGYHWQDIPLVLQFNKRDLPGVYSVETLRRSLSPTENLPYYESVAVQGIGVTATLKRIIALVLARV